MQKVIICIGVPNAGKSTYARHLVKNDSTFRRLNKDEMRIMFGIENYDKKHFSELNILTEKLLAQFLKQGYNVVVDNTNLNSPTRKALRNVCQDHGDVEVIEKFFPITLKDALERNSKRSSIEQVPEKVIQSMFKAAQHAKNQTFIFTKPTPISLDDSKLNSAVIFDLDGTLADISHRNPYDSSHANLDPVIEQTAIICSFLRQEGHRILFVSGRQEKDRAVTNDFIKQKVLKCHEFYRLFMRADKDQRRDVDVKRDIFEQHIRGQYNVFLAVDDRNQVVNLWRQLGIRTFQVADGDF